MCNSETLPGIFSIVKRIMFLIQIIVPILLIVFASLSLIKLLRNPEEKNGTKKIINQFIAAVIVFFIPLLVDVVMNLAGDSNQISSCWMSASDKNIINTKYRSSGEKERKKITYDATDYEVGRGELDFSCTSKTVKAQFSCETLKIVEKHLYDFDATTFKSVIKNKYGGDFGTYAKSVGGIFGEYYGKNVEERTEADFQRVAEYVLGWMYMYGWDYSNSSDGNFNESARVHVKCKGDDCFYKNGGFVGQYLYDDGPKGSGSNIDGVISTKSQGGSTGRMASACGDLEVFIFNKLGIIRKKQLPKVSRLKDLQVGDCLYFGNGPKWDKLNESKWTHIYGAHNVVIGEVYPDHVVIYDAGSYYPRNRNYKRELYFPKEDTEAADDAIVKKVFGYSNWGIRRWYDFEES